MKDNYDDNLYYEAEYRVRLKRQFTYHRNSYVLCMIFLTIINLWTSPSYLWVKWPALGWGLGLAFHWMDTVYKLKGKQNYQDQIQKEMDNLKRRDKQDRLEEERMKSNVFTNEYKREKRQ